MSVSRSAIAKWENDKGMPDINNLKAIAQLLNVSIDYLLDDEEKISFNEIKEPINLDEYVITGKCREKRDAVCVAKHKEADAIYALFRTRKMNKLEWLVDFIVQPGVVNALDQMNELADKVDVKKFVIGKYKFKKGYQIV